MEAYYFTITKETRREVRLRLGDVTAEELTPAEALKKYLESKKDLSAGRAKILQEYGEKLIQQRNA